MDNQLMELGGQIVNDPKYFQEYYSQIYDKAVRSEDIGIIKQDQEKIMNLASVMLLMGLKRDAPIFTGNLMFNGINGEMKGKLSSDIIILAPGQIDKNGRKLPDYGWQTDMLSRLRFYTTDGEFINAPNKNKGWVEKSIATTLEDLIRIIEKGDLIVL